MTSAIERAENFTSKYEKNLNLVMIFKVIWKST